MMGRDSREVGSPFYLIHLLIWVRLVSDLCLNFVDKVLKNHDINLSKISKKLTYNSENMDENVLYTDFENSKIPKNIEVSARIGIPNKGIWTEKKLRFFVKGNKFVSGMKKAEMKEKIWK